jgi:hypothetical protein
MSKLFIPCDGYELSTLQANFYKLIFQKIPHVEFFCQTVRIPDMNFGFASQPTTIHDLKVVGEKLEMQPLTANVLVDEKLEVYTELYNWMYGISVNGFAADTPSDCIVEISGKRWHFRDVFPIQLGGFTVTSAESQSRPVSIDVSFAYDYFTFGD